MHPSPATGSPAHEDPAGNLVDVCLPTPLHAEHVIRGLRAGHPGLHTGIAQGRHGTLKTVTMELRTALLWEGYQLGLDAIAMDVLHSGLDMIVTALTPPASARPVSWIPSSSPSRSTPLWPHPSGHNRCGGAWRARSAQRRRLHLWCCPLGVVVRPCPGLAPPSAAIRASHITAAGGLLLRCLDAGSW
jgi:hypothetical protein